MRPPSFLGHLAFLSRLRRDSRGVAATEFALIAPALIFLVMGVFEMSFRFRATEEATRYVHQIADLVSRETALTTEAIGEMYGASVHMMKPLDAIDNLDLDVSSVGFEGEDATPTILWRRVAGHEVTFDPSTVDGMGVQDESVIRVGVRYNYQSVLSELFGGGFMAIEKTAYARPRIERKVSIDGAKTDGGAIAYVDE
jgi:Flp pilus assembly protein TadG